MSIVRYQYVSAPRRRHPITVAYTAEETSDGLITVSMGLSFCHKMDHFSRQLGREIAQGRMEKVPHIIRIPLNRTQPVSFGKLVAQNIDSFVQDNSRYMSDSYRRI